MGVNTTVPFCALTTMRFSTSTAFDISDSSPPSVISESDTASTLASGTPGLSRHFALDVLTFFKVEDKLFRFDRTLLDQETNTIPQGVGSKEDPIKLERIKVADFEVLLDFLKLGTRHDKEPLTVLDWTSIITVCSILGMQRVRNHACETLSDQHKTLLDQQKTLMDRQKTLWDRQNAPLNISRAGAGFEKESYGMYFLIREKGTANYLHTFWASNTEGTQVQLWNRDNAWNAWNGVLNSMVFFVDKYGALHHAASGLAVDIVDDVPVLRRNRPVSSSPNPWSRPLPEFSFVNSQIRVKFLSDPALPSCSDGLYPKGSWATKDFVLAVRPEKDFHMHPISDFSPWIPAGMTGSIDYNTGANHDKQWRVLVEGRTRDVGDARTSWEIVAATKV